MQQDEYTDVATSITVSHHANGPITYTWTQGGDHTCRPQANPERNLMQQDDLVLVTKAGGQQAFRYVHHINEAGEAVCYAFGATSITATFDGNKPLTHTYAKWEPYMCGEGTDDN